MQSAGSTVRKDFRDLSKPLEVRELNRQLEWLWKQLLGGLNDKSFSSSGLTKIVKVVEKEVSKEIETGSIETSTLVAALSELMVAVIGVANINYASIVDLYNDRLFTDVGTAGEFRANKLVIDKGQINDLEVGVFRLVSSDGNVYKIDVDENGNLTSEFLYDQDEWFEDGSPPEGYNAIASSFSVGEMTAGTLYVTGDASFMKVIAKVLEADEGHIIRLFSTEGSIDILKTYDIRNDDRITLTVGGEKKTVLVLQDGEMVFGDPANVLKTVQTGERFSVRQGGVDISYFSGEKFWIRDAEIDNTLRFGNYYVAPASDGGVKFVRA